MPKSLGIKLQLNSSPLMRFSPVTLYHSTFQVPPSDLLSGLHNISPQEFEKQCMWLKENFSIVSIDEYTQAKNRQNLAAITFDDAYKCIFSEALPILISMDLPATIFVNGCTLEGKPFWRDKVRLIINRNWVDEFERFNQKNIHINNQDFYRYTKNPVNNSKLIEQLLDEFLLTKEINLNTGHYCADDLHKLVTHPLISYGNHSQNHYVLSSLNDDEKYEEIHKTKLILLKRNDLNISNVFSVPFGGTKDIDEMSLQVIREVGYQGLVMSRGILNGKSNRKLDLEIIERFMPDNSLISAQYQKLSH